MTKSSTAIVAGVLAASLATACSDNAVAPTRAVSPAVPNFAQDPGVLNPSGPHLFRTRQWHDADNAAHGHGGGGGGSTNNGIFYHGGPVLQSVTNVVAIYWSASTIYNGGPTAGTSGSKCVDNSLVGTFLSNLGGSPYFNINHTYTDGGGNKIVNAVSYVGCWANDQSAPSGSQVVSDADMQSMILGGFGTKISYDPNTLYAIFTGDAVNLGGGFGSSYCAYHGWFTATIDGASQVVKYAAMPYDYAFPTACSMFAGKGAVLPPNGDPGADAEVNTLGHETEETTTDPEGTAWFDRRGFENADKCAWNFGTTYTTSNGGTANMKLGGKDFLVQQNWVNANGGGCALHFP